MELRQIHYLLAVAEEGSFTRASDRLGVAQSAISTQIAKLEDEIGVTLLHRGRPSVTTTEAGAAFAIRMGRVVAEVSAAKAEAQSLIGQTLGEVIFCATFPAASLDVPAMLAKFRVESPAVTVTLREGTTSEVLELLRADRVDLAVVAAEPDSLPAGLGHAVIDRDDLVLVGRRSHRLERLAKVPLKELDGEDLVGFRQGAGLRAAVDRALAAQDVHAPVTTESNELPVLIGLVRHGLGLAVLPRSFISSAPKELWIRELVPQIRPHLLLVWRQGRRYLPAAEEFLRFVVNEALTQSGRSAASRASPL